MATVDELRYEICKVFIEIHLRVVDPIDVILSGIKSDWQVTPEMAANAFTELGLPATWEERDGWYYLIIDGHQYLWEA